MGAAFRQHLRAPDDPRIAGIAHETAQSWADRTLANPRAAPLFAAWRERYLTEDFHGITVDGRRVENLYPRADDGAPAQAMTAAAERLLAVCDTRERERLTHPLDARERRAWMNPEVYMHRFGLRLDEMRAPVREAGLSLIEASLSDTGYRKARDLMRVNAFLGDLVGAPRVMNEFSYNLNLFGAPSERAPWGWNFYGHHLSLNCLVAGGQLALAPMFMGAEPNIIDAGPYAGTEVLAAEESAGLALMRSLPAVLARRAQLFRAKRDPAMPPGRVAMADELHLAGAFRDNRVIPYEGAPAGAFDARARRELMDLIALYLGPLPDQPRAARLGEVERHLDDTHFCWIGGTSDDDPFYYRIQSPVILIEFDHHAGVFLGNTEPEKFHIHTIVRAPNGNDYGMEWLRMECERRACGTTPASPPPP
jgi:hypothetical protein